MDTICVMCPLGCPLHIETDGSNIKVTGNTCARGAKYGAQEFTAPKRMITALVKVNGGGVVSAKSSDMVDKSRIGDIIKALAIVRATAPIKAGDLLCADIAGSGVGMVATENYPLK